MAMGMDFFCGHFENHIKMHEGKEESDVWLMSYNSPGLKMNSYINDLPLKSQRNIFKLKILLNEHFGVTKNFVKYLERWIFQD